MTNNLNAFAGIGSKIVYYGLRDGTSINYVAGTDGSLAAGEDSGMARLIKHSDLGVSKPQAQATSSSGDNGVGHTWMVNPTDAVQGTMGFATFDQTFNTKINNDTIYAEGPSDIAVESNECYDFQPMVIVVNSPAKSSESATWGEQGYMVTEYWYVNVQDLGFGSTSVNTPHSYTHALSFHGFGYTPYGEAVSTNYNVNRAWGTKPYWSKHPVYYHTYVGDGTSAQTFTLGQIPYEDSVNGLEIWEAGTKLAHSTNYSVNTSSGLVTFVSTDPADGAFTVCKVRHLADC